MIYRFRIILDSKNDVIRDLEINSSDSLKDFHFAILKSFGFAGKEMASFYLSNSKWDQGDEIPVIRMEDDLITMGEKPLKEIIDNKQDRLIYVYDFFSLWTFLIELMEIGKIHPKTNYPNLIFSKGDVPEEAPVKNFEPKKNH